MTVAALHPEHLLEKHARGELSDAERAHLDAHLASCATCRFEVEVRADFADELSREEERISGLVRLVEEATKAPKVVAAPPRPVEVERISARRRRPWAVALIAAAAMLVVVGAAASEAGRRVWVPIFIHDPAPVAPPPSADDEVQRKQQQARVVAPVETAPNETAAVIEPTPPPPPVTTTIAPPPAVDSPGALLDAESDARRRGDYARVIQLHSELIAKHPRSHEAQTSRITVARMLLDRGDADGALAGFDAYLANGSGELGEDALAGRATALERLGRKDEARTAWAAVVEKYPSSTWTAHANARMAALADR